MTSILFVDSRSTVGKNVHKNVIKRLSFVELACTRATHFAALEWCGSAVASVRLTARVLWDWGGLASGPRYSLRTWTGDTFTHHLVTTFFASCSWHFRSPRQSGKSSDLTTKVASSATLRRIPMEGCYFDCLLTIDALAYQKRRGKLSKKTMTFYLQKMTLYWDCIWVFEILWQYSEMQSQYFDKSFSLFWEK